MALEALIFDVDGTIAETEELHRPAFNEAFKSLGLTWNWDLPLYKDLLRITGGKERLLHYVKHWRPEDLTAAEREIPRIHELKTRNYVASLRANGIALRPGVARLMQEARDAGVKLAIATTTDPANLTPLLRSVFAPAGEAMFSAIVSGDEVAAKKPAPDVFQLALTRLGLPASSCIAFEDSANGVTSARRAGLAVVATPSAFTPDDDLSLGVSVVSDMGEPGRPHRHVAGWMWPGGVVTLESLRVLLAKVHG